MLNLKKGIVLKYKKTVSNLIINLIERIEIMSINYMENGTINYLNIKVLESNYRPLGLYSWNQYYINKNYTIDFESELDIL